MSKLSETNRAKKGALLTNRVETHYFNFLIFMLFIHTVQFRFDTEFRTLRLHCNLESYNLQKK